jgi:hypothetical protein
MQKKHEWQRTCHVCLLALICHLQKLLSKSRCNFVWVSTLVVGTFPSLSVSSSCRSYLHEDQIELYQIKKLHNARKGKIRNAYKMLVGRLDGKRPFRKSRDWWGAGVGTGYGQDGRGVEVRVPVSAKYFCSTRRARVQWIQLSIQNPSMVTQSRDSMHNLSVSSTQKSDIYLSMSFIIFFFFGLFSCSDWARHTLLVATAVENAIFLCLYFWVRLILQYVLIQLYNFYFFTWKKNLSRARFWPECHGSSS